MEEAGGGFAVGEAPREYNLAVLNAIRAARGLGLFVRTASPDTFATTAHDTWIATGVPHGYFSSFTLPELEACGFTTMAAEDHGLTGGTGASTAAVYTAVDRIIAFFMAEEALPPGDPARGHFEAIANPGHTRIGVAPRRLDSGALHVTNELSGG